MKSARQTAFEILLKIQRDSAYSNIAVDSMLSSVDFPDKRDSAFVCAVVYGTLDRLISIDYNLSLYLTQPLKKLRPELLTIMRMGVYQLLFMDKVPASAAVNESVKLAKENKSAFAASLVNAVLRKVSANGFRFPDLPEDSLDRLEVQYSCPGWILELWSEAYGAANAVELAKAGLEASKTVIRVNTVKTSALQLIETLEAEGVKAEQSGIIENALVLENPGSVERLESFKNGLFHVQDFASQLCCAALDPQRGETVFDVCSAPGGKAFTIAERMENIGTVNAFDIYQSRVDLIRNGAKRLSLDCVKPFLGDASIHNEYYGLADRVLCDVPCSGLGIIRRKPEIRGKKPEDLLRLPPIQKKIIACASRYVKPGGRLVYSTCTLNPAENEQICNDFLAANPEFYSLPVFPEIQRGANSGDYLTLMPHINNTDGFFIAAFCRREEK